jgi:hypothetical protein
MHHFIFPSKDTYITNLVGLEDRNFGIDEILNVAAQAYTITSVVKYQSASMSSSGVFLENLVNFSGSVDAYFSGSTTNVIISDISTDTTTVYGSAVGYVNPTVVSHSNFISSDFTGNFTGSLYGYVNSAIINGVTYTNQLVSTLSNVSGSVVHLSGSLSGSAITGQISGSLTGQLHNFSGSLNNVSGTLLGSVVGTYSYYSPRFNTSAKTSCSRTLLKFDVTSISSSISKGDIVDPKFILRLNVLEQQELPFEYSVYAYPISQSWEMGDGRYAEAGSQLGASWNYRNVAGGQKWHNLSPKQTIGDYLTDEAYKEDAFSNGGGTWYYSIPNTFVAPTSSVATPFFDIESSVPTFDQQYSSSLASNLSSSFNSILSSSLNSVLSQSLASQQTADEAYALLTSIADPTYQNTSSSIADYLSTINQTASLACNSCSLYQYEYSSSTFFVNHLSSSIQTIIHDSSSAASYADLTEQYYVELSSSLRTLSPTTFNQVYSILNQWSQSANSASLYATNVNNTYLGFSASLSTELGTTDPYLIYVSQSMAPLLTSSLLNLLDAQFSSSATNSFSSSLVYYINQQIDQVETQTSASVANTLTQSYESSFYTSLVSGSSLIMSQSFSYEASDIKMDITPIVKTWIAGGIPNEGIILLTSEELTVNSASNGLLGFYSKETNTIYSPHIDVVWDDSTFVTSSLEPIDDRLPFVATIKNLKKEYKHNSVVRVNVFARDKFPLKNFVKSTQQTAYLTPKYLPQETYYSIKDTETEEVIIDFDIGTKLSCDSNGNYFMLDMTGLPQERYFKILLKTEINGGVEVIDNNTYFKVVR